MGGLAFSAGSKVLRTPRMPAHVYQAIKTQCHARLLQYYFHVATPAEGPEKPDFGDVDILVAGPRPHPAPIDNSIAPIPQNIIDASQGLPGGAGPLRATHRNLQNTTEISPKNNILTLIKYILGAEEMKLDSGPVVSGNFAVPWPKLDEAEDHDAESQDSGRYVQVDVRVCETQEDLQWMHFKHGHGDLWNLLGVIIRPFGLTCDDTAFHIRIHKIEKVNNKVSRVPLTRDPDEVLRFLGLPRISTPFLTLWDMYEYASKCRLFWINDRQLHAGDNFETKDRMTKQDTSVKTAAQRSADDDGPISDSDTGVDPDKWALKSNDRKRLKARPGFQRWIEEYIPSCRKRGLHLRKPANRYIVLNQAFAMWPQAHRTYYDTLKAFQIYEEWLSFKKKYLEALIPMPELVMVNGKATNESNFARQVASGTRRAFLEMLFPEGAPPMPGQTQHQNASRKDALEEGPRYSEEQEQKTELEGKDGPEVFGATAIPANIRDAHGVLNLNAALDWIETNKEQVGMVVQARASKLIQERAKKASRVGKDW